LGYLRSVLFPCTTLFFNNINNISTQLDQTSTSFAAHFLHITPNKIAQSTSDSSQGMKIYYFTSSLSCKFMLRKLFLLFLGQFREKLSPCIKFSPEDAITTS